MTILEEQQKLAEIERLIDITRKTREDAIRAKTESETKLNICVEELAKLGVTPETAESELERLNAEIDAELIALQDKIPIDLLQTLHRI